MSRVIASIYIILFWALHSYAQEWSTHWISYPLPNDSSEVFFCHTYLTRHKPQQAFLSFASSGRLRIYVNERNISRDIVFNNPDTSTIAIQTYNVTDYLRPDSNIIAVWYAPEKGDHISQQLSLEYYGTDDKGKDFYHKADGTWFCQRVEGCYIKEQNEWFDARQYDSNWKATDGDRNDWLHPLGAFPFTSAQKISNDQYLNKNYKLRNLLYPLCTSAKKNELTYDFGRVIEGTPRATIRDAHKGCVIEMNGLTYTCNGEMDEQAFRRFTTSNSSSLSIRGDQHFKKELITNLEVLEYE